MTVSLSDVLGRDSVHPFPARMAPSLAVEAFARLKRHATVLDPMAGSGTVLALARASGHRCVGFDVDPLAVLISRVWTRTIDRVHMRKLARRVLERAKRAVKQLKTRDAYPFGADAETQAFIRYWFDPYARRQLTALAAAIGRVKDSKAKEALWCGFSRLIIAKQSGVSLALDLAHSRPHRRFKRAPRKPFKLFLGAVERVVKGCLAPSDADRGPLSTVRRGDVRNLPIPNRSVDLVFTSPPYLNAIDYLRCSKFSLVWMGYTIAGLREIRATSIGAEVGSKPHPATDRLLNELRLRPKASPRILGVLRRYAEDSNTALREVARVLRRRGNAVYVVGENTVRGTYIPTARLIIRLARRVGLRLVAQRFRKLPGNRRYLPPPGRGDTSMDTRIRREAILTFARRHKRKVRSNRRGKRDVKRSRAS
jgi:DNA modification methylase